MKEKNCKCDFPDRDSNFSICMKCSKQLGSYHQCLNCLNKGIVIPIIGIFKCKKYGWIFIKKQKKINYCEYQNKI